MKSSAIFLFLCLLFPLISEAQQSITFRYDAAGNRDRRLILTFKMNEADSSFTETVKPQHDENSATQKVTVYPNPTDALVNIEFTFEPEKKAYYVLAGVNGTIIMQEELHSIQTQLNLEKLGRGTYMLRVESGDLKEVFKIVKQ